MPWIVPFIPLIASALPMVLQATGALGGGEEEQSNAGGSAAPQGQQTYGGGAMAPGAANPNAPGMDPNTFRTNENAHYQQLFAGLGQGLPGGALPQGVQENIDRQASLL